MLGEPAEYTFADFYGSFISECKRMWDNGHRVPESVLLMDGVFPGVASVLHPITRQHIPVTRYPVLVLSDPLRNVATRRSNPMADWESRVVTTKVKEYVLPSPTNWTQVQNVLRAIRNDRGGENFTEWDDDVTVAARDDEIVFSFTISETTEP